MASSDDGTRLGRNIPGNVYGLSDNLVGITTRYEHSCAFTSEGVIKCWGWNYSGQLGNGVTHNSTTPKVVAGLSTGVTDIISGETHSCALLSGGVVKCWGGNVSGQLGDGTWNTKFHPSLYPAWRVV